MLEPESHEFRALNRLTQQTDYRSLCRIALDLAEHYIPGAHCDLIEIYRLSGARDQDAGTDGSDTIVRRFPSFEEIHPPVWLPLAIQPRDAERPLRILSPEITTTGDTVYCLGAQTGVSRALVIRGQAPTHDGNKTLAVLMSVFANCLTLLDKVERDPLTDLLNRQSFDYRFDDMLSRYRDNPRRSRISTMPWLVIADIDHFKRVNDTLGHLFGDEILLRFSQLLRQAFRFDDLLFRYGGEEFIVILNNTDAAGARDALERFRLAVERYEFPSVQQITVSLGWVGVYPNELPINLLQKADRALYAAKQSGRNRVVSYEAEFGDVQDSAPVSKVEFFAPLGN